MKKFKKIIRVKVIYPLFSEISFGKKENLKKYIKLSKKCSMMK